MGQMFWWNGKVRGKWGFGRGVWAWGIVGEKFGGDWGRCGGPLGELLVEGNGCEKWADQGGITIGFGGFYGFWRWRGEN